jgi:DNA polymerase zeta
LPRSLHGINAESCVAQNVTYGYTGASFSGRMPCVEIADDIVQTGRETLEKVGAASPPRPGFIWLTLIANQAIQFIESQHHWGARVSLKSNCRAVRLWLTSQPLQVIYGDTDSLFVLLEGRTIPQAFRIGNEMAEQITARNPRPIKLKFEKVRLGVL